MLFDFGGLFFSVAELGGGGRWRVGTAWARIPLGLDGRNDWTGGFAAGLGVLSLIAFARVLGAVRLARLGADPETFGAARPSTGG